MREQFATAIGIQRDGSKQILSAMVTYSEHNNDNLKTAIDRYQKIINELDLLAKLLG